ncbi:hypothetical protein ACXDF8_20470 [Mycolicibacterium sp. CBM1]
MTQSDRRAVLEVVEKAYAILEFDPGGQPDWLAADKLYAPLAVFALRVFPDDPAVSVMTWPDYKRAQMAHQLTDHGYSETPGESVVHFFGDVAVVYQYFTMNFRHRPAAAAVDVFGMVRSNGTWQIVSVLSDLTPPPAPTPT